MNICNTLREAACEIKMILNSAIDFAQIPDGDTHRRRFVVSVLIKTNVLNPSEPKKYAINVYYMFDGIRYTVISNKPTYIVSQEGVDAYIDMIKTFAYDIANGYQNKPIERWDEDFNELVKSGRIKRTVM